MSDQATTKAATMSAGEGRTADFPVLKGTLGPDVIDVRKLYGQTGMFTYDPGFTSTASCSSKITFIDGDEGILLHRGYTIEDLAKNSSFLEVAYLILNGELPKRAELENFVNGVVITVKRICGHLKAGCRCDGVGDLFQENERINFGSFA